MTSIFGGVQEPSLRWTGNQKQQYKSAVRRARERGHSVTRNHTKYGPLNEPRKYSIRCTCGEHSLHMTEARQIAAEREHIAKHGRK